MNVIKEIERINKAELENGSVNTPASWHMKYADSAWVYVGNLPLNLTEGDILAVMSQWGEIEDINLVRDNPVSSSSSSKQNDDKDTNNNNDHDKYKREEDRNKKEKPDVKTTTKGGGGTGKSKGFAFIKYEDARSCVLAVDNFCGTKILGRSIRVDHVENYRLPKHLREKEEEEQRNREGGGAGHAYQGKELANSFNIQQGHDLFDPNSASKVNGIPDQAQEEEGRGGGIKGENTEERKAEKRKRKEERDKIRRERQARKESREEKRRERRARKLDKEESRKRDSDHRRHQRSKKRRHDSPLPSSSSTSSRER